MSDRESDVRDTASKSLSLLICFCDDKDKLTSLVDSCLDVIVDDTIPIDNGLQVNRTLAQLIWVRVKGRDFRKNPPRTIMFTRISF